MAATNEEVVRLLRRLFNSGPMTRLPKSRKDTEIVLALAASRIDPRAVLSETDVNETLADWLEGVADQRLLDHVTIRRYLIDYGMLFRDPEGHSYRANQAVINRYIDVSARTVVPADILQEVSQDRARRRRENQVSAG